MMPRPCPFPPRRPDRLQLEWRRAFTFMSGERHWRDALLRGGLLLLLAPPFGWHVAMGYRRAVGLAARGGARPLLPCLGRNCLRLFGGGWMASLVIVTYSSPALLLFWLSGIHTMSALSQSVLPAILFAAGILMLPPLAIPLLPLLYLRLFPFLTPSPAALAGCGALLMAAVFVLPAAFLNVSVTGSLRSACRIDRAVGFIIRNPRLYFEAWAISLTATAAAFLSGPFCPWGLFWSYLTILSAFNQALVRADGDDVPPPLRSSILVSGGRGALCRGRVG